MLACLFHHVSDLFLLQAGCAWLSIFDFAVCAFRRRRGYLITTVYEAFIMMHLPWLSREVSLVCFLVCMVAQWNCTKWLYVQANFEYPLFLTFTHQLSTLALTLSSNRVPASSARSCPTVKIITTLGGLSIVSGNVALLYLHPAWHSVVQTTSPIWALVVEALLGRLAQTPRSVDTSWRVVGGIAFLTIGCAICAADHIVNARSLSSVGISLSILAVLTRAIKSNLQFLLLRTRRSDVLALLYHTAVLSTPVLLISSTLTEGTDPWYRLPSVFEPISVSALIAVGFNVLSLHVTREFGTVKKEAASHSVKPVGMMASNMLFGRAFSHVQYCGVAVALIGAALFACRRGTVSMTMHVKAEKKVS